MSLRSLYTLVGAAWGVVLGAPTAVMVSGYLLAAAWLFLFGDDPWPAHSWLVLLPGPIAGIAIMRLTQCTVNYHSHKACLKVHVCHDERAMKKKIYINIRYS